MTTFVTRFVGAVYKAYWRYYPFSLERLISKEIGENALIGDLGCGDGMFASRLKYFRDNGSDTMVGCDIHMPYILSARKKKVLHNLIQCDIRRLPFKDNCFDAVMAIFAIEHLEKKAEYLDAFENLAKGKIIITTSNGYSHNPENGVIYQRHLSGYEIDDFKNRDYLVRGFGCKIICGKWYKEGKIPVFIRPVLSMMSLLATAITYYYPQFADHIICIKQK